MKLSMQFCPELERHLFLTPVRLLGILNPPLLISFKTFLISHRPTQTHTDILWPAVIIDKQHFWKMEGFNNFRDVWIARRTFSISSRQAMGRN